MKKLLTTGAILAAGASLVNAATLLQLPESGLATQGNQYQGHRDAENVLNKVSGSEYGIYAGNNGGGVASWPQGEGLEGNWKQDASKTSGTMTLAGRNGTQGESFALVLGNELSEGLFFNSVSLEIEIPESSLLTGKSFNVGIGYWSQESSSFVKTVKETVSVQSSGATTSTITLALDLLQSWNTDDKIIVGIGGPGATPPTNTYSVNVKSVSVIPEASAFGLLGGLGVLALASSRRRRK